MTTRQLIRTFLDRYCIKVEPDEPRGYIEHMLKHNELIEYDEVRYYIPNHDFAFTVDDDILGIMLFATYKV
jgi:hypothetical protein